MGNELCLTLVAFPVDPLFDLLADTVLKLSLGRDNITVLWRVLGPLRPRTSGGASGSSADESGAGSRDTGSLAVILRMFRFLDRIARALLATLVRALSADLVRSKRVLATMALAMNSHANRLLHSLGWLSGAGHRPFMGFQRQAIFFKEGPSLLLLLDRTAGGLGDNLLLLLDGRFGVWLLGLPLSRRGITFLQLRNIGRSDNGRAVRRRGADFACQPSWTSLQTITMIIGSDPYLMDDGSVTASPEADVLFGLSRFKADLALVMNLVRL